jgi:hypothetical protein
MQKETLFLVVASLIIILAGCDEQMVFGDKEYISKDADRCSGMRFACREGMEPFFSDDGCGCQKMMQPEKSCSGMEGFDCMGIYDPVCGYSDPEKVQCLKYPCASMYNNSCLACENQDVIYYVRGECPG